MIAKFLEGVRVVEFGQFAALPLAGTFLSDMGVEVVKVEPLGGDPWRTWRAISDTEGLPFMACNRGKRGIAIDLKSPASAEILNPLISSADAVMTNYRPNTLRNLGIDYEHIKAIKEDIVYVAVTALEGEAAQRAGYDWIAQAASGMLAAEEKFSTGGVPMPVSSGATVDVGTGYLTCFAVCAGLLRHRMTGRGSLLETSLLASAMGYMSMSIFELLDHLDWNGPERAEVKQMARNGASLREIAEQRYKYRVKDMAYPWWFNRCYETADGTILVCCLTDAQRALLLQDIEIHPDSGPDIGEMLAAAIRRRTAAEWIARFASDGVPAEIVRQPEEVPDDPTMRAAGLVVDVEQPHVMAGHFRTMGPLLRVDGDRPNPVLPSPALGQHTTEILAELGISDLRACELIQQGVVRGWRIQKREEDYSRHPEGDSR